MTALGPAGGVVDMRAITGERLCQTDPFSTPQAVTGPVTLLLGNLTINITAADHYRGPEYSSSWAWRVPANVSIVGTLSGIPALQRPDGTAAPGSGTLLKFSPASPINAAIAVVGRHVDLDRFSVIGNANIGRLVDARGQSDIRIHNLSLSNAGFVPPYGTNSAIAVGVGGTDVWVTDNTITQIGSPTNVDPGSGDIYVEAAPSGNSRFHIRNNQISGSRTSASIACMDCIDSDAIGNRIDENNQIRSDSNLSLGYGIVFYGQNISTQNVLIQSNNVTNTAGSGIYCASCTHASISNNVVSHVTQRQSDDTEPAGCVAVNGFDHGSVTGNVCIGSHKDGISIASAGYGGGLDGSVFSGNTVQNVAGNGFNIRGDRTLTHFIITGNTVDQIAGASKHAYSIYPGVSVQSVIITNNLASGGSYNLDTCGNCTINNNL